MSNIDTLRDAQLHDIPLGGLRTHVPNPLAKDTPHYLVEYGIRIDDGAMIFHFFPPKDEDSWDLAYGMDKRLERAIAASFDPTKVTCGFAPELSSFYVIVGGLGAGPDPWLLVERFFGALDASPEVAS